jgi:hypothetical protein
MQPLDVGRNDMAISRDRNIDRLITNNLRRLCKCGALTARPGYEIAGHRLTRGRIVVATVRTKKPMAGMLRGAGLATLTKFLSNATSSLIIGLYDFTSASEGF